MEVIASPWVLENALLKPIICQKTGRETTIRLVSRPGGTDPAGAAGSARIRGRPAGYSPLNPASFYGTARTNAEATPMTADVPDTPAISRAIGGRLRRFNDALRNGLEVMRFGGLNRDEEAAPYRVERTRPMYRLRH